MKKIIALMITSIFIGIIFSSAINGYGIDDKNNTSKYEEIILEGFFDKYMKILMRLSHKASLSAGIIKNDRLVWSNGYGLYDIENSKSPTPDTLYLIASISKTVTATALMQLYEKELFDLDDDVNNYLPFSLRNPNFPDIPITFRMILSHRSSLASDNSDRLCCSIIPGDPDIPSYPDPWLKDYLTPGGSAYHSSVWSDSSPGEQFYYANIGYSIIGYLVELISSQNFNEYCIEHIFVPLEMYNTSFRLRDHNISEIAIPYFYNKGDYIANPHYGMIVVHPSASMRTSIQELSHFLIAHMNKGLYKDIRILNETTIELMHTTHYPPNNKGFGYGLGWIINEGLFGKKTIGHSGGWPGVHTQMIFRPNDKTGILIFTNSYDLSQYSGPVSGLAFKLIINALFNKANRFHILT